MEVLNHLNSKATNAELANITTNVGSSIDKSNLTDDYLSIENQHMKLNAERMLLGKTTNRTKALSDAYSKADSNRDGSLTSFVFNLKGFVHGNDQDKAAIAQKLLNVIRKYGKVQTASYETETALLDSMLIDLKKPEQVEALTALNLNGLVAELEANQNTFKTLFAQSAVTESEKKEIVAPSALRKETLEQLNSIVDYLNLRLRYHKSSYGALASEIAELINGLNAKIGMRKNGGDNTTEDPMPDNKG